MHTAIVTGGYYRASGVHTHIRDLSHRLSRRGMDVSVLSPDVDEEPRTEHLHPIYFRHTR